MATTYIFPIATQIVPAKTQHNLSFKFSGPVQPTRLVLICDRLNDLKLLQWDFGDGVLISPLSKDLIHLPANIFSESNNLDLSTHTIISAHNTLYLYNKSEQTLYFEGYLVYNY